MSKKGKFKYGFDDTIEDIDCSESNTSTYQNTNTEKKIMRILSIKNIAMFALIICAAYGVNNAVTLYYPDIISTAGTKFIAVTDITITHQSTIDKMIADTKQSYDNDINDLKRQVQKLAEAQNMTLSPTTNTFTNDDQPNWFGRRWANLTSAASSAWHTVF